MEIFVKRLWESISTHNFFKIFIFFNLFVILVIPPTVFLAQQQDIRQRAAESISCNIPTNIPTPVLGLAYYPRDPNRPEYLSFEETGWGGNNWGYLTIQDWENRTQQMITVGVEVTSDATRYHGYKDPNAPRFLNYSVLETKKFYEAIPRGIVLDRRPGGQPKNYRPHYGQILRDLNICDYVDIKGVKEVWMYGYHNDNTIVPDESRMSSRYGDISNSLPHEEQISPEFRMPICNNSYVLYNFTYQPVITQAGGLHNRIHQLENVIPFAEGRWPPIREDQPGSNIRNSIFWGDFSEYVQEYTNRSDYRSSCGNAHLTPNWRNHNTDGYRYNLTQTAEFNCETWYPDDRKTTYMNAGCERWGCTEEGFYKWFLQNIPGYNNDIVYQDQKMRNWWEAMYDFNAFIDKGRSLYGESIFCNRNLATITPPTTTPTPSPTIIPVPTTIEIPTLTTLPSLLKAILTKIKILISMILIF